RSRTTRPTRSISRPCAARVIFSIPNDGRAVETPRLLARTPQHPAAASPRRVRRPHAEWPLCARAHHHHLADGAAPVGADLRVLGAPLADGDASALHLYGAEHCHAHRALPDEPARSGNLVAHRRAKSGLAGPIRSRRGIAASARKAVL